MKSNIEDAILEFQKNCLEDSRIKENKLNKLRINFIANFPLTSIRGMSIDEYIVGKQSKNSFCYILETELKGLGSIKGGATAYSKFGIYYSQKKNGYKTIKKWSSNLDYQEAFAEIKKNIILLLEAGENKNLEVISKNKISPMFKNKILTTYFPNYYISIFSEEHVNYFLQKLDIDSNDNIEIKRQKLIDFKNNNKILKDFSNFEFMEFLYWWNNPKYLENNSQVIYPDEIDFEETYLEEGKKKTVTVNVYERNSTARAKCIEHYGTVCGICGFDFGKFYGERFDGKIHVHHKKALHEIDDSYEVDPIKDLIPVCPNCHMILHAKSKGVYTVNEVKSFIKKAKA